MFFNSFFRYFLYLTGTKFILAPVTKPPYPANISFYTIAGKDTNLCAMSGTGFRKRGEEYNDETNNQWYDQDRVSGS